MYTRIVCGKRNHMWLYSEFVCDTTADIATLPNSKKGDKYGTTCCAGSKATVIDTGDKYILNHKDEWKMVPSGSGGSSGETGITDDMIATEEEAKSFLGF